MLLVEVVYSNKDIQRMVVGYHLNRHQKRNLKVLVTHRLRQAVDTAVIEGKRKHPILEVEASLGPDQGLVQVVVTVDHHQAVADQDPIGRLCIHTYMYM